MQRFLIVFIITILIAGFIGSSYAAYNGVGLITSGTNTNSRGVFFVFLGGGPGFGK